MPSFSVRRGVVFTILSQGRRHVSICGVDIHGERAAQTCNGDLGAEVREGLLKSFKLLGRLILCVLQIGESSFKHD